MMCTCTGGYRGLPQPCSSTCIQADEAPRGCVAAVVHWESAGSGVEHLLPQPDVCLLRHGKSLSIKEKDPCEKAKIIIIIATSIVKQKFTRFPSPLSCSQGRGVKAGSLPEEVAS